jgi:hypothetical protein
MAAAADDFSDISGKSWWASATHAASVTPSDTVDLTDVTRWVFVGGAGDLNVIMADGTTVLLAGVNAGALLPIRASRVKAGSTSATGIIALW